MLTLRVQTGARFLAGGILIAIGIAFLLLAYAFPPSSCCSKQPNGQNVCTECAYTPYPSQVSLFLGVLALIAGGLWLSFSLLRPPRPSVG